ncbi:hypothetical protein ACFX1S_000291 [Malus domestica]
MAPTSIQGALNMGFQMAITIGILMAGLVNYATAKIEGGYGWRLFLALAAVPSLLMTLAALFLPDTPNSILERGRPDETKKCYKKIPWHQRRDEEFQGPYNAAVAAKKAENLNQWRNIIKPSVDM